MAINPLLKFDYAYFVNIWRAQWQKKAEAYRVLFKKPVEPVEDEAIAQEHADIFTEVTKAPEKKETIEELQELYKQKFGKAPHFSFKNKYEYLYGKIYS